MTDNYLSLIDIQIKWNPGLNIVLLLISLRIMNSS